MLWALLFIILLPIVLLIGATVFLSNPLIGIICIICVTAIVITKIIKG